LHISTNPRRGRLRACFHFDAFNVSLVLVDGASRPARLLPHRFEELLGLDLRQAFASTITAAAWSGPPGTPNGKPHA
jgi:hypothetical protein